MSDSSTTLIQEFDRIETDYLERTDKPHVGFMCLRVPVELIEACDCIPVRIKSEPVIAFNDSYGIRNDACSFCRSIPEVLKLDRYKKLSAIIGGSCCDQMRRVMDTLHANLPFPVILFGAPRTWGQDEAYFTGEMLSAFSEIQKVSGRRLKEDMLPGLIAERSEMRSLIAMMRDAGVMTVSLLRRLASSPLPASIIIHFLNGIPVSKRNSSGVRLALTGSIPGGKELDIIEECGGSVVADLTCLGDRVFRPIEREYSDPIRTLYYHYVENNLCPFRKPFDRLIEYTKEMTALRKVKGLVYRSVKFCHPFGLSARRFREELDLPFLQLDDDLTLQADSSFRTRIGAFIETLEARLKRSR